MCHFIFLTCVTSRRDLNLPSALLDLIKEMSDDGLYIPESSITLRSIVGKGDVYTRIIASTVEI